MNDYIAAYFGGVVLIAIAIGIGVGVLLSFIVPWVYGHVTIGIV